MELREGEKAYVWKYYADYTDAEKVALKKLAMERFANDEHAQLEYALLSIISEAVYALTPNELTEDDQSIKENENGSTNNDRQ
jgi:hypothetical protein